MKSFQIIIFILTGFVTELAAQQNWAAIPCSRTKQIDQINKMFVDSLHNEIILNSISGYSICNAWYKGLYAYNGSGFHDLDRGIETHDGLNLATNGSIVRDCIRFGNQTLFGGGFLSVGTNTLYAKSIALWNGMVWSNFPTPVFDNTPNWNSGGGILGFFRWNGKLWMYGGFDTIGNTITKNIAAFDGYTYTAVPSIPASDYQPVTKMVVYKNKLIATGNFDNNPPNAFTRLAAFDGISWSPVGNGVVGGLSACRDMVVYKDTLYIAGAFPKAAGNAGNYIMKWDGTQLSDAGFGNDFCGYGPIARLIPYRNRLYAFGGFACAAGQKAFGVAYYENGAWTVPKDSIQGPSIIDAVLYNDQVYIGGFFQSINSDTTIKKFAKLLCPDFDAATGCASMVKETTRPIEVTVGPNPAKNELGLGFSQRGMVDKITITNTLGQLVYTYLQPEAFLSIDVSHWAAGVYFLKVENKQQQVVIKVVKE